MDVTSGMSELSDRRAHGMLRGLPEADGFEVRLKPLRYREKPHLAAETDFSSHTITLQVPEPFLPFGEIVAYGAKRRPGRSIRFIWLTEGVTFRTPREVVRFLYLHEFMHCYLHRQNGRGMSAETTCERFALGNYRQAEVTLAGARTAMRRQPAGGALRLAGPALPCRVEPRDDLLVQDAVGRQDRPAVDERRPVELADLPARLLDDHLQGGEVPRRELQLDHHVGRAPGYQAVPPGVAEPPVPPRLPYQGLSAGRVLADQPVLHPGEHHEGPGDTIRARDADRLAVQPGAVAHPRLVALAERRQVHDADDGLLVDGKGDQVGPDLDAVGEVLRAVDRVDDPAA